MKTRGWRRVASAIWRAPADPQIYGALELDVSEALAFAERARTLGHHVTPTQLVGRALALALREVPELNVLIRRGKTYPRDGVDVFFITAVGGGHDLSGVKIVRADEVPAVSLGARLSREAAALRSGRDKDFQRTKTSTDSLPFVLLRPLLRFMAWFTGERGKTVPGLGLKPYPFGSAMITSVGMFGLPVGFAPLVWMYKVPLMICVGELERRPRAVGDRVEIRPILPVTASVDHRYVDGSELAHLVRAFKAWFADPWRFEPELTPAPG